MKNLYFLIWSDAILRFKKHHPNKNNWESTLLMFITWMHALNVWIVFLWLKYFDIFEIPLIRFNIFPGDILDKFSAFAIEFAAPFALINYILIFHKNKYERIIKKYSGGKKQYAQIYSYSMILGAFVSAILYGILTG